MLIPRDGSLLLAASGSLRIIREPTAVTLAWNLIFDINGSTFRPSDCSSASVSFQRAERISPVGHEGGQQAHRDGKDQRVGCGQPQRVARVQRGEGDRLECEEGGGERRELWHPPGGGRD